MTVASFRQHELKDALDMHLCPGEIKMPATRSTLSPNQRLLIEASVPVLREYGLAISRLFYARLFEEQPQLLNLFNQGNQANGAQQGSLAAAVLAYAANIDNPGALRPVIARIAHKHASVGVEPSQYALVGRHLLAAIQQVLGDGATPALLEAWAVAYSLLAEELIASEAGLHASASSAPGALSGLTVADVRRESSSVSSYYLKDPSGASPGRFLPGQYVSVAVTLPDGGRRQLRQYSLSDSPERPYWRITVKRETQGELTPAGLVSSWIHANVRPGDTLFVSPAFGNFNPAPAPDRPLALLSAGVGITPMVSALNALVDAEHQRPVLFAHAARSNLHRSLFAEVEAALARLPSLTALSFLEELSHPNDARTRRGRMLLGPELVLPFRDADFFLCGPRAFMREQWQALTALGVPAERIQREVFGPELLEDLG
jgi:nitric oxide dioxygenase